MKVRRRALIVDDHRDSVSLLCMQLAVVGYECRGAFDGDQAIDIGAEFCPDAILLDLNMPRLNGYDTCRLIRQRDWGQHAVIVAFTGYGELLGPQLQECGFNYHLTKPVQFAEVERLLAGVLAVD
jgi:CheY-like chemotaxis protein